MAKFFIAILFIVLALLPFGANQYLDESTTNFITEQLGINYEFNATNYAIYLAILGALYWLTNQLLHALKKVVVLIVIAIGIAIAYVYFS